MNKDITARVAIAEEAAEWFIEWREAKPSRHDKQCFADWLSESPVHVEEYLAVAKLYGELAHVNPSSDVEAFVDDTIVALHGDALAGHEEISTPPAPARSPRRRWMGWGLAASVLVAITASVFLTIGAEDPPVEYVTSLGEQRSVLLADGSVVSLNTQSRLQVDFTEAERRVRLLGGEALFEVENDPSRAFFVETASAVIRVTGTQFNVYEQGGETAVTVIEGTVEVAPRASPAAQQLGPASEASAGSGEVAKLAMGDQAVVRSGSVEIEAIQIANLEPVTAWTDRRLVFDATPLSEIVAEFNRYNHQRLVLDDASVADIEVSGVFGTNDPESLVLFLERIADVEVTASVDGSVLHVRAASVTQ